MAGLGRRGSTGIGSGEAAAAAAATVAATGEEQRDSETEGNWRNLGAGGPGLLMRRGTGWMSDAVSAVTAETARRCRVESGECSLVALGRVGAMVVDSLIGDDVGAGQDARTQTGLGVAAGGATTNSCGQRLQRALDEL